MIVLAVTDHNNQSDSQQTTLTDSFQSKTLTNQAYIWIMNILHHYEAKFRDKIEIIII